MMLGNTPYVVSRAKARRQKLADRARLRQLINQSVDQLTVAVGDLGYRTEIDLYAGKLAGGDLVEAALTHNLESELTQMVNMTNKSIRPLIEIYTSRFDTQSETCRSPFGPSLRSTRLALSIKTPRRSSVRFTTKFRLKKSATASSLRSTT